MAYKQNRFSRPTDYDEENDILLSELPEGNPLIGHYKELFSKPENDSELFYREGHKIIKMQNKNKKTSTSQKRRSQKMAEDLMESEQFNVSRRRTPSREKQESKRKLTGRRHSAGRVDIPQQDADSTTSGSEEVGKVDES